MCLTGALFSPPLLPICALSASASVRGSSSSGGKAPAASNSLPNRQVGQIKFGQIQFAILTDVLAILTDPQVKGWWGDLAWACDGAVSVKPKNKNNVRQIEHWRDKKPGETICCIRLGRASHSSLPCIAVREKLPKGMSNPDPYLNGWEISAYVWVHNRSNMPMFCLKKSFLSPGWFRSRNFWKRGSWPNGLACLNLNLTQGHPLVAKFSNMCHFRHFLRVPRKAWPKSTGLPWKI